MTQSRAAAAMSRAQGAPTEAKIVILLPPLYHEAENIEQVVNARRCLIDNVKKSLKKYGVALGKEGAKSA